MEPGDPFLSRLQTTASGEGGFRSHRIHADYLRRALRATLELPALPFEDPYGEALHENHDEEFFRFKVGTVNKLIEMRIKR